MTDTTGGRLQKGWLAWYTLPNVNAPYAVLQDLAEQAGFPPQYLPSPPKPRSAWEKATNLGARGLKLDVDPDKAEDVRREHGSPPKVRLYTHVVSRSMPKLVRHLVREVVVPRAEGRREQRRAQTVAVLSFETGINERKAALYPDEEGWVTQDQMLEVLGAIDATYAGQVDQADGDELRATVRKFLDGEFAVPLRGGGGGVYFVPLDKDPEGDGLASLRAFLAVLEPFVVREEGSIGPHVEPAACYVELYDGSTAGVADARSAVLTSLRARLMYVHDQANRIPDMPDRFRDPAFERVLADYADAKDALASYRQSLDDGLQEADDLITFAQNAVRRAGAVVMG